MASPLAAAQSYLRIGCAGLPPGLRRRRYFEQLDFLETSDTAFGLPTATVLRRWRTDASSPARHVAEAATAPAADFALAAPLAITHRPDDRRQDRRRRGASTTSPEPDTGWFRDTPAVREATAALGRAAETLDAEVVLFRTPASFAPSQRNRDAMRHFFSQVATAEAMGEARRAWEPQGLWEPCDAARLSEDLGLTYACDPLMRDPTAPNSDFFSTLSLSSAYLRITGLGRPARPLDQETLETLLGLAQGLERCWLVFATVAKHRDAVACRRLAVGR